MKQNRTAEYFKKRAEARMDNAYKRAERYMFEMDRQMVATLESLKKDIIHLMVKIDPDPIKARQMLMEMIPNDEYNKLLELSHKTKNKNVRREFKKRLKAEVLKPRISRKRGCIVRLIESV